MVSHLNGKSRTAIDFEATTIRLALKAQRSAHQRPVPKTGPCVKWTGTSPLQRSHTGTNWTGIQRKRRYKGQHSFTLRPSQCKTKIINIVELKRNQCKNKNTQRNAEMFSLSIHCLFFEFQITELSLFFDKCKKMQCTKCLLSVINSFST